MLATVSAPLPTCSQESLTEETSPVISAVKEVYALATGALGIEASSDTLNLVPSLFSPINVTLYVLPGINPFKDTVVPDEVSKNIVNALEAGTSLE